MSKEFNPYEFTTPQPREQTVEQQRASRVETEVIRIEEGEEDETEEGAETPKQEGEPTLSDEEEEKRAAAAEAKRIARESNPFWQFISGNWLILDGIAGTYAYLLVVAAALFLSVVSIFYSFHLGEKYTRRSSQVQLLRERELEFRRARFNATSHTAILRELKERGIPVYDIQESKTIIDK